MPLLVKDPRGVLTSAPERVREQLTSSVDLAPLLLTIASGSDDWRRDPHYSHIADRADLAGILADPTAPGRPYVLHATDETVTEFAIEPYAADAPLHVVALRTPAAKLATYSNWPFQGIEPLARGRGTRAVRLQHPQRAPGAAQQRLPERAGGAAASRTGACLPRGAAAPAAAAPDRSARARLRRLLLDRAARRRGGRLPAQTPLGTRRRAARRGAARCADRSGRGHRRSGGGNGGSGRTGGEGSGRRGGRSGRATL